MKDDKKLSYEYYARNNEEQELDDRIRRNVYCNGSKVDMTLFVQNQAILSMLRRIEDKLELKTTE